MIVSVVMDVHQSLRKRAAYAIGTVLDAAGVGCRFPDALHGDEDIVLSYGASACPSMARHRVWIQCPCCPWLLDLESNREHFVRLDQSLRYLDCGERAIPFWGDVAGGHGDGWAITPPRGKTAACRLRADLFGNVFLHLSRIEEWCITERDQRQRFEWERSSLGKAGLLSRPVVDEYISAFGDLLQQCCQHARVPLIRKALWPGGEAFAVCLTHDVDRVKKWTAKRILREMLSALCQLTGSPDAAGRCFLSVVKSVARRENPYWNLDALLEDEDEFGLASSFYFSTERKLRFDPSYAITEDRIRQAIQLLRARNREVGLHPTYDAFDAYQILKAEHADFVRATGFAPRGLRFHYLRFDERRTLRNADRLGLAYDTTLGYAGAEGFRAGTSLPFHPFDLSSDEPLQLLEMPLCIMDRTLTEYRGYDAHAAQQATRSMWDRVCACHGLFSVLLHQACYDVGEYPYLRPWYRALLSWTRDQEAFCATAEQIADWWVARSAFRLLEARRDASGSAWRFESAHQLRAIKLLLTVPTLPGTPLIEILGPLRRMETEEGRIGLLLGPVQRGQQIRINASASATG